ncbi:P-II family nitrogen regulator [Methanomassiliicoccus luminyensis]|jgi:nitrogen regulatory protein PII 2|uniref:P-II family nitrogen regulator n=1 Tax=Methanomassiliicoccus luminyensis TaxID=1080712 RepID=UPI00037AB107|nr:P-II family nitrogen regulator [Methanomassiliicoccus luminyensis]
MKEIMAIIRMNMTGATKKALVEAGVAGFTAVKVLGRGMPQADPEAIEESKKKMLAMAPDDVIDPTELDRQVSSLLDGTRPFPRRLFTILAHDEDVPRIVEAITKVNKSDSHGGDGIILVLPISDAVRVRTGESGEAAIW